MLRQAEEQIKCISKEKELSGLVPRISYAVEYLAKALIYAMEPDKKICERTRKEHNVSELLVKACAKSPIPLTYEEVKAIAGIAFLNAMLCNRAVRAIIFYGVEALSITFPEAARKAIRVLEDWRKIIWNVVDLLKNYYSIAKRIIEKAGTFIIEVTEHDFKARNGERIAKKVIRALRPTALYAHARVRQCPIGFHGDC